MLRHEPQPAAPQPTSDQTEAVVDTPRTGSATGSADASPRASYASLFEPTWGAEAPRQPTQEEAAPAAAADVSSPLPGPRRRPGENPPTSRLPEDQTRAAAHLQAAGQTEAAVHQYLAAVRDVALRGEAHRAFGIAEQGLKLLEELPGRLRTNAGDAVALEELAETHHLLARLPMHAPIRPGQEAEPSRWA